MLCRVALVRTGGSEGHIASVIKVTKTGELRTLAVTSNPNNLRRNTTADVVQSPLILVILLLEALRSSKTRHNITEDGIIHSRRRKILNLK
jgi:hypothetical protein